PTIHTHLLHDALPIFDTQDKKDIHAELASTQQELASTTQRMTEIRDELDAKIEEVKRLGGNVADLEKAKAEIDAELKRSKRATGDRKGTRRNSSHVKI